MFDTYQVTPTNLLITLRTRKAEYQHGFKSQLHTIDHPIIQAHWIYIYKCQVTLFSSGDFVSEGSGPMLVEATSATIGRGGASATFGRGGALATAG